MNILWSFAILHVYPDFTDNNLICSTVRPYGKVIPPGRPLNNRTYVPSCYNLQAYRHTHSNCDIYRPIVTHTATVIFATAGTRKACIECFLLLEFTEKKKEIVHIGSKSVVSVFY